MTGTAFLEFGGESMPKSNKENRRKLSLQRLISGVVFFLFVAGALVASMYFKIIPMDLVQKLPFMTKIMTQNNADAVSDNQSNDQQQPVVAQQPSPDNTATSSVDIQNTTINPPAATPSVTGSNSANGQNQTNRNISKLSQLYSGMKPQDAVAILNNLDDQTISNILKKMDENQASMILAAMDTKRASLISKELLKDSSTSSQKSN
jgi:flagellar protein FlbB